TSLVSIQSATVHNRLPRSTVIVVMFFACECASFSPTRTPRPLMPKPRRKRIQSFGRMSGLIPMVGRVFRFNFGKGTGSSNPWSFPAYQSSKVRVADRVAAEDWYAGKLQGCDEPVPLPKLNLTTLPTTGMTPDIHPKP